MKRTTIPNRGIPVSKSLVLVATGVIIGLFLTYYLKVSEPGHVVHDYAFLVAAFLGALMMPGLEWMSSKLDDLVPWQAGSGNRLLVGFVLVAVIVLCASMLVAKLGFVPQQDETNISSDNFLTIKLAILSTIFSLVYAVVYFARYSYKSYATLQIETIRQERKQINLQLKALKSQLSPHFLFNSLNTVSTLIYKGDPNAEVFVRKLALMYQYVLDSYEKKMVLLKEELNFAIAYGDLLQTRFGDSLKVESSVDPELSETKIPPVTLQMLVENAVKHNVADDQRVLKIRIFNEGDFVVVANNVTEKNSKTTSHRIGLKNIDSRYQLLTGKKTSVEKNDFFTVKLPIIR